MRTGCQWQALSACFGDDSSVHRRWLAEEIHADAQKLVVDNLNTHGAVCL